MPRTRKYNPLPSSRKSLVDIWIWRSRSISTWSHEHVPISPHTYPGRHVAFGTARESQWQNLPLSWLCLLQSTSWNKLPVQQRSQANDLSPRSMIMMIILPNIPWFSASRIGWQIMKRNMMKHEYDSCMSTVIPLQWYREIIAIYPVAIEIVAASNVCMQEWRVYDNLFRSIMYHRRGS